MSFKLTPSGLLLTKDGPRLNATSGRFFDVRTECAILRKEDSQMHDLTLVLAIFAIVLLAYQSEIDDRPPVQDDDRLYSDQSE